MAALVSAEFWAVPALLANTGIYCAQVCKAGKVQLLDKLITYGADMNAQNHNGNTPLHICAAEDQVRIDSAVADFTAA